MKILAFVDLHGSIKLLDKIAALAKKDKADYIVCAGDITIFGDSLKPLIDRLDKIGIPTIMLHGNHENESTLRKACNKTKNIKFMHKEVLETDGHAFIVYGGGGFSTVDKTFDTWSRQSMQKIGPDKKIILVTHAPPYGTKIDKVFDQSAGNKSIRDFIKRVQPKIAISGHLHENAGLKDKIGKTLVVNPGPWGMMLSV
jgi:Icc-related predicted phosphoesterase